MQNYNEKAVNYNEHSVTRRFQASCVVWLGGYIFFGEDVNWVTLLLFHKLCLGEWIC